MEETITVNHVQGLNLAFWEILCLKIEKPPGTQPSFFSLRLAFAQTSQNQDLNQRTGP
jgi:hypothetical protein